MKKDNVLLDGEPWDWEDNCMYPHICCDCGLTHMISVNIIGKKIRVKFYRDSYRTNRDRKEEGIVVYKRKNEEGK